MFQMFLILFVTLTLTSCSWCTKTIYVDREVEVKVPVKCIVPDTECNFDRNTSTEVVTSMLECIIEMKQAQEVCK